MNGCTLFVVPFSNDLFSSSCESCQPIRPWWAELMRCQKDSSFSSGTGKSSTSVSAVVSGESLWVWCVWTQQSWGKTVGGLLPWRAVFLCGVLADAQSNAEPTANLYTQRECNARKKCSLVAMNELPLAWLGRSLLETIWYGIHRHCFLLTKWIPG